MWHATVTECQADIFGVIDWQGQTTWIGEQAGHADVIVGDPSSASAYVAGLGPYCQSGRFASADGGLTWSAGALPGRQREPDMALLRSVALRRAPAYYPGPAVHEPGRGRDLDLPGIDRHASRLRPHRAPRRLVPGKLFESTDDGVSWRETGPARPMPRSPPGQPRPAS